MLVHLLESGAATQSKSFAVNDHMDAAFRVQERRACNLAT